MLGAIIGDTVGSRFEFNNIKTTEFQFLNQHSRFTDDTVCTVAFMDWLLHAETRSPETATEYLHRWVRKYPDAGYGGRFYNWMLSDNPKPYGSYGNGSAMRISSIAWAARSLEELIELSDMVTGITHNHPEGLKGARVIATCIYMAIHGSDKEDIGRYATSQYPELYTMRYQELRRTFTFNETCQGTVPEAIYCFLISNNYEDCIRKTISIGGDCDTTAAMSGAIAEAYWGIPEQIVSEGMKYLDEDMKQMLIEFYHTYFYQPGSPTRLERFRKAQMDDYDTAVRELQNGRKTSHWMWYMFPQVKGLGMSDISEYYSLTGLYDAKAYYEDAILGPKLKNLCKILLECEEKDVHRLMGSPDDLKLKSSMTLFYLSTRDECFKEVLVKYYDGQFDHQTLKLVYTNENTLRR